MKITKMNADFVVIDEKNVNDPDLLNAEKIHLIKLNFLEPTREKIQNAVLAFPRTNRFVISNNIKMYNDVLKTTSKKYYVENEKGVHFISFLRKNNKILLNFSNLKDYELAFILETDILYDILKNVEVVQVNKWIYSENASVFSAWDGNLILED